MNPFREAVEKIMDEEILMSELGAKRAALVMAKDDPAYMRKLERQFRAVCKRLARDQKHNI